MIILDTPYVSNLLQETIIANNYEAINNTNNNELDFDKRINFLPQLTAIELLKQNKLPRIYCNSENSINWINNNLNFTDLPENINIFKDKVKFRSLLKTIYPNFYFKEIDFKELETMTAKELKFPFIIKPAVGFLSIGVHAVNNEEEWPETIEEIKKEILSAKNLFPTEVVNTSKFIIEEIIKGEEYAIDAYYDENGKAVVLNILKHPFSNGKDVSDRIYYTSKKIIVDNLPQIEKLLSRIGDIVKIKNFPLHLEVRIEGDNIIPIEINPMRFAGWCTTDLAYFAYKINVYEYFLENKKPDWETILKNVDDSYFYFNIADIPSDINKSEIKEFQYEDYLKNISNALEIRKINFNKNPIFGIFFGKTKDYEEIKKLLTINLSEYITLK